MKILKIEVFGLPLFKNKCEIDFTALQRVTEENAEKMSYFNNGNKNFYLNNVISLIGINASGKTTALRLIVFICRLLNNEPINSVDCSKIFDDLLDNEKVIFNTYFYAENGTVNLLRTVIVRKNDKVIISDEELISKSIKKIYTKKTLFEFDNEKEVIHRDNNADFLLDDVSIMVAFNKKYNDVIDFNDMLRYTNINQLSISEDCPPELISFFDPSVDYLKIDKKGKDEDIHLKFKGKSEITLKQFSDVNSYLSSGTIKGINIFLSAIKTFKTGGYLIVDELENHFNQEIVSTLIRFYMDKSVNPNGATLIFSTHYSELLDEFERNDNVYIVKNNNGISIENLSTLLKRNDIKKSEAYQSGFLEGTVPMYEAYMDLKESIIEAHRED